jgi:hypothetical protein
MTNAELSKEEYNDNWPEGSLEELIWGNCEADNTRVREIMERVNLLIQKEVLRTRLDEMCEIGELVNADGELAFGRVEDRIKFLQHQLDHIEKGKLWGV